MDGRTCGPRVRHSRELIEHIIDVRLSMYVYGSHPPGHPRVRSFPSLSSHPFALTIPLSLSLTNGAAYGNANFCVGRVVVLTRRKTSNGELTFSFVPRARFRARPGATIFSKSCRFEFYCWRTSRANESARATSGFGKIQLPRALL